MSRATVRIPTPLRRFTGGAAEVTVEGATVGEALAALADRHRDLGPQLFDEGGELRRFVNVYLGDRDVRTLERLDSPLGGDGGLIHIVPAVAGGGGR